MARSFLDIFLGRPETVQKSNGWDSIEKSLLDAESIEKSRKGVRRAQHKYIRVFTGNNGKDQYLYPEDLLKPFKLLLSAFGIGKEKIEKTYQANNIERAYGVDKNVFGAHLLEYLTNRIKWDTLFKNKAERDRNKKPVAQKVVEDNADKVRAEKAKTVKDAAESSGTDTQKRPTINRSLMRKIYSLYNPVPEDKAEPAAEQKIEPTPVMPELKPALEKIMEFVGRKTIIKPDGTRVYGWNDGRVIHTDRKGNVIYDNASLDTQSVIDTASETPTEHTIDDETVKHESELEAHQNRSDAMLGNDNAKKDLIIAQAKDISGFVTESDKAKLLNWSEMDLFSVLQELRDEKKKYEDEWNVNVKDGKYDVKLAENITETKGNIDNVKHMYMLWLSDKGMSYEKAEEYISDKLSEAMKGNQNAKKDGITVEETAPETKSREMQLKEERDAIVTELAVQDAEFKHNGGYSYKRTTAEQDAKRRVAQEKIRELKEKLNTIDSEIESMATDFKVPEAHKENLNTLIKRKLKGDSVSWAWIDKKGIKDIALADGIKLDVDEEFDVNSPKLLVRYHEGSVVKRESWAQMDVMKYLEGGSDDVRWYRHSNVTPSENDRFYSVLNAIKDKILSQPGETQLDKFYNLILGVNNIYTLTRNTSGDLPSFRFDRNGFKDKSGKFQSLRYGIGDDGIISISAEDYGSVIPSVFNPENDTDYMTDYFDKDQANVRPDHPYYNHVKLGALKYLLDVTNRNIKAEKKYAERYRQRAVEAAELAKNENDVKQKARFVFAHKDWKLKEKESLDLVTDYENRIKDYKKQIKELEGKLKEPTQAVIDAWEETEKERRFNDSTNRFKNLSKRQIQEEIANRTKLQNSEKDPKEFRRLDNEITQLYDAMKLRENTFGDEDENIAEPAESEAEEHENRSRAMLGNQNAKKDFTADDSTDNNNVNGGDNNDNNTGSGRIPERNGSIRGERGGSSSADGNENESESGRRNNTEFDPGELRERSGERQTEPTADLGRKLKKREILEIREQCEKLLAEKKDDEFTEADKELLRQYAGAGGTGKEDATSAEVLNEYYTPYAVISKVWELVDKYNPNPNKTVIEPSAGVGRFAEGRPEKFTMFELSETTGRINRILHPDADVHIGTFQKNFMQGGMFTGDYEKFDVAVGNPPYGRYTGREKGKGEGKEHSRYEEYFIDRTLDTLKDGGILAMVIPSSVLRSPDSKTKKILESKGELLEAWRLPNGTFDTTDVGTDIIIMRKGKGKEGSLSNDAYFESHPECILGAETERIGRFGNTEKYVGLDGKTANEVIDAIDVNKIQKKTSETIKPAAKTEIKKEKKTDAEKKRNRSEAMKGNDNAKGEHQYPPSAGHIMNASEFAAKYINRDIDPREMEVWKHTDYRGNIAEDELTPEQIDYIQKSDRYIKNEDGRFENVVTYASGNIVEKLNNLDPNDPQYEKKRKALEEAKPKTREIGEFTLSTTDTWVWNFRFGEETAYDVDGKELFTTVSGHGIPSDTLFAKFFAWAGFPGGWNNDSPISKSEIPEDCDWYDIRDYILGDGLSTAGERYMDSKEKEILRRRKKNQRREAGERLFNRFIQEGLTEDEQHKLRDEWNKAFNSNVNPDYSLMPVFVDGMSTHKGSKEFNLLNQQIKGVSFLASKGSGLLAYDVGVGKTVTGIVATVNQIQTGKAKRPLICVPAAVYPKWLKEIKQHFPNQEIVELKNLRGSKEPDYSMFKDGALHVCTYEALDVIGFTEETEDELYQDVEFATDNPFKKENKRQAAQRKEDTDFTVGQMTQTKGSLKYEIEKMGIDHITVDEIHNFNHVFASERVYEESNDEKNGRGIANEYSGMGGRVSPTAQKMFAITQYIQRHNNNRNVFGLSATPFTNKPAEVYSILSLVARKRLKEIGITSLQDFLRKFADISLEYVVTSSGKVEQKNVMKSFKDLSVLQALIEEYIDKVDGEEAGVIRPHKKTYTPMLEKNALQDMIVQYELERMNNRDPDNPGAALVAMNNMRQALLSPSFVNENLYPEYAHAFGMSVDEVKEQFSGKNCVENSPKLKFVCDSIIEQYKQNNENSQFMYVPRGVEHHKYIKEYLIKHGIPEDAVELLGNETGSKEQKLKKFQDKVDDFNNPKGKLKVIIGNESTKEGVSLNGNTTTVYNTMLGWNPTEATQVEGRVWRQGNKQGVTSIVYPLIYDSLDARLYQLYEEKKGRIDSIFSYKGDSLNVEDIKADEMKYALIRDPEVKADMQLDSEKRELESEIRLNDTRRDMLHDTVKAFDPLEEDGKYQRLLEIRKDYQDGYNEAAKLLDEMNRKKKELKSKNEEVSAAARKWLENKKDWQDHPKTDDELVKIAEKRIKARVLERKMQYQDYNRRVKFMETQHKQRLESLAKQGLHSAADVNEKIESLTQRKIKAQSELDNLKNKRAELIQKYTEELEQARTDMPSVESQVKDYTRKIVSTLKPMDEVKTWIKDMRSQGMTNQQIKDAVDAKVTKSFCYAMRDKDGQIKVFFQKSVIEKLAEMF